MKSFRARVQPLLTLGLLLAVLLGCGLLKKKPEPAASASAAVAVAPAAPTPPPVASVKPEPPEPPPVADDAIPTAEDFEDEAFEKVTEKTYKPELDTLKKEIEGT